MTGAPENPRMFDQDITQRSAGERPDFWAAQYSPTSVTAFPDDLVSYLNTFRGRLVRGNREWEMKSHSISPSFLCLDKFYKNRMEPKVIPAETNRYF